jgi:hypothetical protein
MGMAAKVFPVLADSWRQARLGPVVLKSGRRRADKRSLKI